MFTLTAEDHAMLQGVNPKLVQVIEHAAAIALVPFKVLCGLRSAADQMIAFKAGHSKRDGIHKLSNHQKGTAVDICPLINGKAEHNSWTPFYPMAANVKKAASELGIPISWGGDWKSFKDGPHFELK